MRSSLARLFARPDRGATAVEYGLMVVLLAVAAVGLLFLLGDNLHDLFGGSGGSPAG
jgi:pilus assembly protein Flp/PilA